MLARRRSIRRRGLYFVFQMEVAEVVSGIDM